MIQKFGQPEPDPDLNSDMTDCPNFKFGQKFYDCTRFFQVGQIRVIGLDVFLPALRKVVTIKYVEAGFGWFLSCPIVLMDIASGGTSLKDGRDSLLSFSFEVGDGSSISLWQHQWCDDAPLRDLFFALFVVYWEYALVTNV